MSKMDDVQLPNLSKSMTRHVLRYCKVALQESILASLSPYCISCLTYIWWNDYLRYQYAYWFIDYVFYANYRIIYETCKKFIQSIWVSSNHAKYFVSNMRAIMP